jgi:membrane protein implicated in regulation of membrane protease activity
MAANTIMIIIPIRIMLSVMIFIILSSVSAALIKKFFKSYDLPGILDVAQLYEQCAEPILSMVKPIESFCENSTYTML